MYTKSEMGIGTLIVFISFILIAAIAAMVILSNIGDVRNKALETGKATVEEVGTSLSNVQLYAEDGSDSNVDYFYYTIKLSSGSFPISFDNAVLTLNLNNVSQEYTYGGNNAINCDTKDMTNSSSIYNETNYNRFGLNYILKSGKYTVGYLFPGSVVTLCFKSPRTIAEQENLELKFVMKVGATLKLDTQTPALMTNSRIYIFP